LADHGFGSRIEKIKLSRHILQQEVEKLQAQVNIRDIHFRALFHIMDMQIESLTKDVLILQGRVEMREAEGESPKDKSRKLRKTRRRDMTCNAWLESRF
jgi:hypothetical protein